MHTELVVQVLHVGRAGKLVWGRKTHLMAGFVFRQYLKTIQEGLIVNKRAIVALVHYKETISPVLSSRGVHCIYETTCSEYALNAYSDHSFVVATTMAAWRLLSCNPINAHLKERVRAHG